MQCMILNATRMIKYTSLEKIQLKILNADNIERMKNIKL